METVAIEVLDGAKVLGERENLTPGLSGDVTITLKPGRYVTECPGGKTAPKGELIVIAIVATMRDDEARHGAMAQEASPYAIDIPPWFSDTFLDFREKAPLAATANMNLDASGNVIKDLSTKGYLAVGVPGSVAGLEYARALQDFERSP